MSAPVTPSTYTVDTPSGAVTVEVEEQAGHVRTPDQERELLEILAILAAAGEL